jgi:hypothetical protein
MSVGGRLATQVSSSLEILIARSRPGIHRPQSDRLPPSPSLFPLGGAMVRHWLIGCLPDWTLRRTPRTNRGVRCLHPRQPTWYLIRVLHSAPSLPPDEVGWRGSVTWKGGHRAVDPGLWRQREWAGVQGQDMPCKLYLNLYLYLYLYTGSGPTAGHVLHTEYVHPLNTPKPRGAGLG